MIDCKEGGKRLTKRTSQMEIFPRERESDSENEGKTEMLGMKEKIKMMQRGSILRLTHPKST